MEPDFLKWDSDFFNLKVGKLELNAEMYIDLRKFYNWDLLYIFVNPENADMKRHLESNNIQLLDRKVTFEFDLAVIGVLSNPAQYIRSYSSCEDDPLVIRVGIECGTHSRFKRDPRIENDKADLLYRIWVENSISRKKCDGMNVYYSENHTVAGFISWKFIDSICLIDLLSVSHPFRRIGIGKSLLDSVVFHCVANNLTQIQVVTQLENLGACAFYLKYGFKRREVVDVYHYWR